MTVLKNLVDLGQGLTFTESPRPVGDDLLFLDIHSNAMKQTDMDGNLKTVQELPFKPNSLGVGSDGIIRVGDAFERNIYNIINGELELFVDLSANAVFCLSDGLQASNGSYYVGEIGFNFFTDQPKPARLFRIDSEGNVSVAASDLQFPNGIVITPDGKTLIVAETVGHCLSAFGIEDDGSLSNRRLWSQLPEYIGDTISSPQFTMALAGVAAYQTAVRQKSAYKNA